MIPKMLFLKKLKCYENINIIRMWKCANHVKPYLIKNRTVLRNCFFSFFASKKLVQGNLWRPCTGVLKLKGCLILACCRISTAQEFWISFSYSPYFMYTMWLMFLVCDGSGLKAGQFSTQTHLLQSNALVICAECALALLKLARPSLKNENCG